MLVQKEKEEALDPELTFKPKINATKPVKPKLMPNGEVEPEVERGDVWKTLYS
jgi:hypothetical protein